MSKWHGGKGSDPRHVDPKKWEENFERIFGNKTTDKDSSGAKVRDKKDERPSK